MKFLWNVFGSGKFGVIGCFVAKVEAFTKQEAETLAAELTFAPIVEIDMVDYVTKRQAI